MDMEAETVKRVTAKQIEVWIGRSVGNKLRGVFKVHESDGRAHCEMRRERQTYTFVFNEIFWYCHVGFIEECHEAPPSFSTNRNVSHRQNDQSRTTEQVGARAHVTRCRPAVRYSNSPSSSLSLF